MDNLENQAKKMCSTNAIIGIATLKQLIAAETSTEVLVLRTTPERGKEVIHLRKADDNEKK